MKKSLYLFISIVLLASVFHACIPNLEYPGTIVGIVTDKATGEPIRSAAVILQPNGIATSTGNNGYYEFTNLKSGGYAVEVSHKEYKEYVSGMIAVAAGEISHVDIQLEKLPPSLRVVNDKGEDIDELDFGDIEDDITRSFNIFNDNGSITLDWEISFTASWIKSVNKEKGVLKVDSTQTIVLTIDRSKLSPGENTTTIHITSNNGSKELKVKALGQNMPSLDMLKVDVTSKSTAIFTGKVLNPGKPEYTVRGFVYSTSSMPTLDNTIANITANINSEVEYSVSVSGLTSGTNYYVRAYATNSLGISYSSNEVKFSTDADKQPVLNMLEVNDETEKSAYFVAEITYDGDPVYTKRGFVYSTSSMPTLETTIANITSPLDNNSKYTAYVSSLTKGTTYYVRAYADNGVAVAYSANEVKFSTIAQTVQLTTDEVSCDVMDETAILNATMSNVGDPRFEERGFYYGTNPEPTSADYVVRDYGTAAGKYSAKIANLQQSVTYYVRAYAIQKGKHVYGNVNVFSLNKEVSKVTTSAASSVGATTATLNGSVVAVGNPPYSEKGFCYATHGNPTIGDTKEKVSGSSAGNYQLKVTNLAYETLYYYRAYVIQNGTPIYGEVSHFTTIWQNAAVKTLDVEDVEGNSAELVGQVTYVGDPVYSWRGFCYDTDGTPSIDDYIVEEQSGSGAKYRRTITNLQLGETYFVRAFLRQGDKVIYADEVKEFSTIQEPEVITNEPSNITGIDNYGLGVYYDYSVQFNGTVTEVGKPAYTERGFVYGTTSSVVAGVGTKIRVSGSGKTGDFSTTTILNVWSSSEWYVCAYVKTENGYVYGDAKKIYLLTQ